MHNVLNNTIGSPYDFEYPNLNASQEKFILAQLFEQILLFDKVTITSGRLNFPLFFLIKHIGINKVEELIDKNIIDFLIWAPLLFTGKGRDREDGTRDISVIYGQAPIVAGSISDEDLDPEKHIDKALSFFNIHRDRKRIFKRTAIDKYTIPDGLKSSSDSANLIINAYTSNNLVELGLPYEKEPGQLDMEQRDLLMDLGYKVLETSLLSKYKLKSFENYEHYKICEQNLKNIGKAYKVSENTSDILKIEAIPNLKNLYLTSNFNFEDVLNLRYKSNAKYFRKWINQVSESENVLSISKEYLNEIKGSKSFFDSNPGKLVRNIGIFAASEALGTALAGAIGTIAGFGLGLLDTFWLDSILKGKSPAMFIGDIEDAIRNKESTN